MPTELKIRKVRSISISGVQSGSHGDGKFARVLTVRSEDGHIYNITLVSDRAEWLDLDDGAQKRSRRHGEPGKEARASAPAAYDGGLNSRKKLPVVAAAISSIRTPLSRAISSAT
jgi:hypothetical protein